jgi:crossover junction endodeoxyribonuclease RusA
MTLTLPWPVSVNAYYRAYRGGSILSAAGRAYKKAVAIQLMCQRFRIRNDAEAVRTGKLSVVYKVFEPDHRRRDLSNLLKSMEDAMQDARVFEDDSQFARIVIERAGFYPEGKVEVEIEVMHDDRCGTGPEMDPSGDGRPDGGTGSGPGRPAEQRRQVQRDLGLVQVGRDRAGNVPGRTVENQEKP